MGNTRKCELKATKKMSSQICKKHHKVTNVGKEVEKKKPYTVGRKINWCRHYGKHSGRFPSKY